MDKPAESDALAYDPSALRPNIILAMADDLGYGELGSYGQKLAETPHLDQMAREGLRFVDAYSGNTLCAPARCTIMTGLHTGHCLIRANLEIPLRPQDTTVAEVLKAAGYRTAIIGKWGLGQENTTGVPNKQGFDFFYGYLTHMEAHNYYPEHVYRNEAKEKTRNVLLKENVAKVKVDYFADLMTDEVLKYLDGAKDAKEPFFMYVPYTLPHVNNQQDPEHMNEIPSLGIYEDKPWTHANKGHAAMISYLDECMGKIFSKLKETGLDKNTLVIFTADNGPLIVGGVDPVFFQSSGPLRGYKRDLYEGGMRVPMIARWPGHVPENKVTDRPTAAWDFMPTAAELAGAKTKFKTDGVSILDNLLGKPNPVPPEPMYWEFHEAGFMQAARIKNWKAILFNDTDRMEIYDLDKDPYETHDLAGERKDLVAQMRAYLKDARTPPEPFTTPSGQ